MVGRTPHQERHQNRLWCVRALITPRGSRHGSLQAIATSVVSAPPPPERTIWHRCHHDTGSAREEEASRLSTRARDVAGPAIAGHFCTFDLRRDADRLLLYFSICQGTELGCFLWGGIIAFGAGQPFVARDDNRATYTLCALGAVICT